jgi:DNA replication protein DnaC
MQLAETQNWGYRKLLLQLCESEAADRRERRRGRLLRESKLPSGKTLGNLQEEQLPAKIRRQLPTLLEGGFVERAENILVFGLPGRGKTHFLCALGRELILRRGYAVYFTPTFKLVQQLLAAKKELRLEAALKKLDRFEAIILDDLGYVQQSREEMEVLFTFLAERAGEQQSGVLEMGPDFQGPDDDDGGGGPAGASRHHPGVRRRKPARVTPEGKGRRSRRARPPLGLHCVFGA